MDIIKVYICDDAEHIRDYFEDIINDEVDMEVVGTNSNGQDAVLDIQSLQPDIVLMDIQMESSTAGIIATDKIKQKFPNIKVIILTIHEDDGYIYEAYGVGASDYLIKTMEPEKIVDGIRKVYNNVDSIRPDIAQKLKEEFSRLHRQESSFLFMFTMITTLTNAEIEILKELYNGKKRRQIAEERTVELVTIKTQIGNILKKMQCSTSKELIRELKQLKIFEFMEKMK